MTKQELEQYRSIVAEIDEVKERLKNNVVSDIVVGSDIHFPFTSHVMRVEGIADKAAAERDKKLLRRLEEQKRSIEEFIANIPDSLTRRIFRMRNITGKRRPTWVKIAMTIGGGNTAHGAQKRYERYLKKYKDVVLVVISGIIIHNRKTINKSQRRKYSGRFFWYDVIQTMFTVRQAHSCRQLLHLRK